jgi:hypothetical protein
VIVGILFIIGTASGILAGIVTAPILVVVFEKPGIANALMTFGYTIPLLACEQVPDRLPGSLFELRLYLEFPKSWIFQMQSRFEPCTWAFLILNRSTPGK